MRATPQNIGASDYGLRPLGHAESASFGALWGLAIAPRHRTVGPLPNVQHGHNDGPTSAGVAGP
jgi:hypothetical protein